MKNNFLKVTMMGPNTQGPIHHPTGPHGVTPMQNGPGMMNTRAVTMQQQQQAHMVGPARGQSPHQQVHQVGIVGPGQGGPRMQAPPNMTSLPNMAQISASSPYGYGIYYIFSLLCIRRSKFDK